MRPRAIGLAWRNREWPLARDSIAVCYVSASAASEINCYSSATIFLGKA